jgi:hypothetical protein
MLRRERAFGMIVLRCVVIACFAALGGIIIGRFRGKD